ncbi:MAG: DNA polymerase III subunit delta, partial [Actinomycetota bacterium]
MADSMALANLLLIHGAESVLADRALADALVARGDYEKTVLEGAELEIGGFASAIAPSLFADKRVVVLKDLQDLVSEAQEEVENYLTELDPSLHIIFIHKGGVKGKALLEKIKKLKPEIILCEAMKKESDKASFVAQE